MKGKKERMKSRIFFSSHDGHIITLHYFHSTQTDFLIALLMAPFRI